MYSRSVQNVCEICVPCKDGWAATMCVVKDVWAARTFVAFEDVCGLREVCVGCSGFVGSRVALAWQPLLRWREKWMRGLTGMFRKGQMFSQGQNYKLVLLFRLANSAVLSCAKFAGFLAMLSNHFSLTNLIEIQVTAHIALYTPLNRRRTLYTLAPRSRSAARGGRAGRVA
ncbi:uncharacterized protein BDR25DRAFT_372663 [Lindgomyces ingoldianus]|uniref:Uncharacterized protein n=1 Tax=Lindgomyces ingoldianus TaxID=673940 RepID=A0ACB6QRM1_9PLEO|nr:uncharacterized protein BDR25DRAFT_372663 [Lindgomyces ingoldianus]KAF2468816.1 hypothetical protein BDR25DRAFT_372663 [Lindgomyces ingoldianus]